LWGGAGSSVLEAVKRCLDACLENYYGFKLLLKIARRQFQEGKGELGGVRHKEKKRLYIKGIGL